jgi:Sel1 repeat
LTAAQIRVAQPHRLGGAVDIARLVVIILCIQVVTSCATVPTETPYNLGVVAFKKRDYSEAASQWTKAVAHGDTEAMNNLGYLLYNGYGVDKDIDRAVKLWRDAAVQGESESQWHLGRAHETGIGAERNLPIAYAWYQCAIATVSKNLEGQTRNHTTEVKILRDAKGSLDKIKDGLSAADLEKGRALAAEYIAKYGKPAPEQPHR